MSEATFTTESTVAPAATGNLVDLHCCVFGVGYGVSTLLVLLRLYDKHRVHRLGLDDMWVIFSWVASIATIIHKDLRGGQWPKDQIVASGSQDAIHIHLLNCPELSIKFSYAPLLRLEG
ncbi:hypothetical protein BDP55DRAFT_639348 [Colletotrichum godetiae]|uniref:Uncharacterized protein n=1 Tax=Colletotrichum godetiae TaxID=1209918 RepID=A0AAJ0A850_9PEZI|nr:uncharacterized protein BDP55DRAFT_639348 [Colletotrichum godetiae]KAK1656767.1 hypothetical protein BDP55DRAFT_639348 [Colletotrichum godetiae]